MNAVSVTIYINHISICHFKDITICVFIDHIVIYDTKYNNKSIIVDHSDGPKYQLQRMLRDNTHLYRETFVPLDVLDELNYNLLKKRYDIITNAFINITNIDDKHVDKNDFSIYSGGISTIIEYKKLPIYVILAKDYITLCYKNIILNTDELDVTEINTEMVMNFIIFYINIIDKQNKSPMCLIS